MQFWFGLRNTGACVVEHHRDQVRACFGQLMGCLGNMCEGSRWPVVGCGQSMRESLHWFDEDIWRVTVIHQTVDLPMRITGEICDSEDRMFGGWVRAARLDGMQKVVFGDVGWYTFGKFGCKLPSIHAKFHAKLSFDCHVWNAFCPWNLRS